MKFLELISLAFIFVISNASKCEKKVIVVGAGISGLAAAEHLLIAGCDVLVLEVHLNNSMKCFRLLIEQGVEYGLFN